MASPLGLESGTVRLLDYQPEWPRLYAAEAERIRQALGGLPGLVEHVGSTSVPGLCAKPIIDTAVARPAGSDRIRYIERVVSAGYQHRGEQGISGREFFRRGTPRSYHVHLVEENSDLWRRYIAFRDWLRAHPEDRESYAALKRSLAARFPRDREAYIARKSNFVETALHRILGTIRQTARLILLDAEGSILLVRYDDGRPGRPAFYWATPGGALEPGESFREAAVRELKEETGLEAQVGRELWQWTAERDFPSGGLVAQFEQYFLVRAAGIRPAVNNSSHESIREHRWWAMRDLANTADLVWPEGLAKLVREASSTLL